MKKFDTYKECEVTTGSDEYIQTFASDWTFREIESWMLDTYCIDKDSIVTIRISSVTIFKNSKHDGNS